MVALFAAVLAVSIGLPISYSKWKYGSAVAKTLEGVGLMAFMLPPVVVSVIFLVFWSWLGHIGRVENIVVAHAVVFVALPLATTALGFRSIDTSLVEAAQTMGATERQVFTTIVLPILLPYIVSGLVFVFILSLNEYMIAYMVAGFTVETMPIKIFNNLRMGFQPTMCVGAVLFLLVGIFGFSAIAMLGNLPKLLGGGLRTSDAE
jgi:putative spermidine/putrescine transport system permease protein